MRPDRRLKQRWPTQLRFLPSGQKKIEPKHSGAAALATAAQFRACDTLEDGLRLIQPSTGELTAS